MGYESVCFSFQFTRLSFSCLSLVPLVVVLFIHHLFHFPPFNIHPSLRLTSPLSHQHLSPLCLFISFSPISQSLISNGFVRMVSRGVADVRALYGG
jgi:hypothetical protein